MNALAALSVLCEPAALLVAGFGNAAHADDGAGLLVAYRLSEGVAPEADFWLEGDAEGIPTPELRDRIIIIDSVITGAPGGTVHLAKDLSGVKPRALRRDPSHLERLSGCEGAVALIGIEIERLKPNAPPSEPVGEAIEWIVANFHSLLMMLDVMDDAPVRLSPPSFVPRRYRLY